MKNIFLIFGVLYLLSSCSSEPSCTVPENLSYTNGISKIIEENCFTCHAQDVYQKKGGRIKLYEFKTVKRLALDGTFMGSVNHDKGYIAMPYRKGVKIDSCVRVVLQTWVDAGCVE